MMYEEKVFCSRSMWSAYKKPKKIIKNSQLGSFTLIYCTNSIDKTYLEVTMLLREVEKLTKKGTAITFKNKLSHIFDTRG